MKWIEKKLEELKARIKKYREERPIRILNRFTGLMYEDLECDEAILEECQRMVDEARERILNQQKQEGHSA